MIVLPPNKVLLSLSLCVASILSHSNVQATVEARTVDRDLYKERIEGFWLGACIANWTGLTPEMDKVEPPFILMSLGAAPMT